MKLTDLKGLSDKREEALRNAGITSPGDLLELFPRRYIDKSVITPIGRIRGDRETVLTAGKILNIQHAGFGKKRRLEATITDQAGILKLVWFKGQHYFQKTLKEEQRVSVFGQVRRFGRNLSMAHPELEILEDDSPSTGIFPVYPSNSAFEKTNITSKLLHQWITEILKHHQEAEFLPYSLLKKLNLPDRDSALRSIHMPETQQDHQRALKRFKLEELLLFELAVIYLKHRELDDAKGPVLNVKGELVKSFFLHHLPFELTEGQKNALSDIKEDLISGNQMNRLIQGDVGSGKTVVAFGAMLMAIDSGYQAAFMAPTEILAEQHFKTLSKLAEPLGLDVRLLIGSQNARTREEIHTGISGGHTQIVVGTHAIIQEQVEFANLGLAVIDEQHRFGVAQRASLYQKGTNPHLLVMSATPIPRSLAMTIYSELDVSIIRDMPGGRKPVRTAMRTEKKQEDVYTFIDNLVREGGQAYIVYPLVEESEVLELKDATVGFEKIKKRFPDLNVGLLHGRMSTEEKENVMSAFAANEIQILVSTTVIEVGVDVPNASVMVIEHAERFGLSQLHQLRGRVGRGSRQSYCILMAGSKLGNEARQRLQTMVETSDGFKIAETDLRLRGPGDFMGTRQSGLPEFKYADIVEDQELLQEAKTIASQIIKNDPELELPENRELEKHFRPFLDQKKKFMAIS